MRRRLVEALIHLIRGYWAVVWAALFAVAIVVYVACSGLLVAAWVYEKVRGCA